MVEATHFYLIKGCLHSKFGLQAWFGVMPLVVPSRHICESHVRLSNGPHGFRFKHLIPVMGIDLHTLAHGFNRIIKKNSTINMSFYQQYHQQHQHVSSSCSPTAPPWTCHCFSLSSSSTTTSSCHFISSSSTAPPPPSCQCLHIPSAPTIPPKFRHLRGWPPASCHRNLKTNPAVTDPWDAGISIYILYFL